MKEEVSRILKMVEDGVINAKEAAGLIEALGSAQGEGETPPPPPPPPAPPHAETEHAYAGVGATEAEGVKAESNGHVGGAQCKDPFTSFFENVARLGKEEADKINWQELAGHVRASAKKGADIIVNTFEELSKHGVPFFGNAETAEVTLPLPSCENKTIKIINPVGSIKVVGKSAESRVIAKARVKSATQEEAQKRAQMFSVVAEETDHEVLLRQSELVGLAVDYVIELAVDAGLDIHTESGNVYVTDLSKGLRIDGRSGDIDVLRINGLVDISTQSSDVSLDTVTGPSIRLAISSGNLDLKAINGNLNATTSSGNIVAKELSGRTISLDSVSGNIQADIQEAIEGVVNIRTMSGNAVVGISDGCNCRVKLSTIKGSCHSHIELQNQQSTGNQITGTLGEGSGTLDVSAVNGNVDLNLRDNTLR